MSASTKVCEHLMNREPLTDVYLIKRPALFAIALAAALSMSQPSVAGGHGGGHHAESHAEEEIELSPDIKTRGIELGEYHIRSYQLVEAQKVTVRFVLYASVASERFAETQRLVDNYTHKIRDQVITATRMAPLNVFDEPALESFRRRILVRMRRALPELMIEDIHVSEFQLTVKSL
jgi:hypothetical protein